MNKIQKGKEYIYSKCGNVSLATHFYPSDKPGWDEVCKRDKFFEGVKVIKTMFLVMYYQKLNVVI